MALEVPTKTYTAPWDKITHKFPEGAKFKDALQHAGLDYEVEFRDLHVDGVGLISSHRATVRTDTEPAGMLGIVGPRYEIVQNAQALGFLADIVDSGDIELLGGGYWKGGARPWIQARLPQDILVAGDPNERLTPFIFSATGHDGGLQVTVALSAIRVICQNTYAANLKAPRRFAIRHTSSVALKSEEARRALGISFNYFAEFGDLMSELAQDKFTDSQFEQVANALFPLPGSKSTEHEREEVAVKRAQLLGIYLNSPTVPRGNQYGALQAVTEWYDHVKNGQRKAGSLAAIERKTEDILLGDGVKFKDRAMALIRG